MKKGFYPKLAADGIRKNKRLYLPFILTCIGMVAMEYIITFLGLSKAILQLPGGETIRVIFLYEFIPASPQEEGIRPLQYSRNGQE